MHGKYKDKIKKLAIATEVCCLAAFVEGFFSQRSMSLLNVIALLVAVSLATLTLKAFKNPTEYSE